MITSALISTGSQTPLDYSTDDAISNVIPVLELANSNVMHVASCQLHAFTIRTDLAVGQLPGHIIKRQDGKTQL